MDPVDDPRVLAAAQWLRSDDTAYEDMPDAIRAAQAMLAAADAVDPLRHPPKPRPTIEQYTPASIDADAEIAEFTTMADLIAIPFVQKFHDDPEFFRFSLEKYGIPNLLMAEFDEGRRWLVVGLITGDPPDLPAWEPVRTTK